MSAFERASTTIGIVSQRMRGGAGRQTWNASWLMAERIATGLMAATVTVAVARHLGPAQFGVISYATSLVTLLSQVWTLGLGYVVVREMVRRPDDEPVLAGTVFLLRTVGGLAAVAILIAFTTLVGDSPETRLAAVIIMVGLVLMDSLDGIDFKLQAELQSYAAVIARVAGVALSAVALLVLIAIDAPFIWFVWAIAAEYAIGAIGLLVAYERLGGRVRAWEIRLSAARDLLATSWPLILSGIANSVNLRVDLVMLDRMVGSSATGIYAAAAQLSEVWYFVPTAIAASTFPALVRLREADPDGYRRRLQDLYDLMVLLALPVALAISLSSALIISLLYGPAYADSAPILAVHVWTGPFVFMSAILSRWLVAENRLMWSLARHGSGAVINILLNLVTIPLLGGLGAAIATLVSYTVASYLAPLAFRPTRSQGVLMTRALVAPLRLVGRFVRSSASP